MNNLVIMKDQQAVTSSLQVAETFGKEHRNVLQSIDEISRVAENSADLFYKDTYSNIYHAHKWARVIRCEVGTNRYTLWSSAKSGDTPNMF